MLSTTVSSRILRSLAKLQEGLNIMVDPEWRQRRKLDDWTLAITMETAELIDSYPWKWWKNIKATPDMQNVKIELTDILHFALSGDIQVRSKGMNVQNCLAGEPLKNPRLFPHLFSHNHSPSSFSTPVGADKLRPADTVLDVMLFPLTDTDNAVMTFRSIIQLASVYRFDLIIEAVILAARELDFNLVAYYVAKHTLNSIRQMQGYKSGAYTKVRNGVEDNVLLHECVAPFSMDDVLNEETYRAAWSAIVRSVFDAFGTPKSEQYDINHWLGSDVSTESKERE